ncbi:MAG: VOC family protein [Marinosulfonomonas sp.]
MDLNQITLEAADFDASVQFYSKIGLKLIVLSEGRYARFESPSGATTLSLHHAKTPRTGNTLLYFEVDNLQARYDELIQLGIMFETPPTEQGWLWAEARFSDPSGNKLCLFHAGANRRFPPWRLDAAPDQ